MADSQELKILLRTVADLTGINQVKAGVAETATEVEGASVVTSQFGSILSGALGGAAILGVGALVGALIQIPSILRQAHEEQDRLREKIEESTQDLSAQIAIWDQLAAGASKFADVISIAGAGIKELKKLTEDLATAQGAHLGFWQKTVDFLSTHQLTSEGDQFGGKTASAAQGPNEAANAANTQQAQENLARGQQALNDKIREGTAAEEQFNATLANPTQDGLEIYKSKLITAQGILASINAGQNPEAYKAAAEMVQVTRTQVEQIGKAQDKVTTDVEREVAARKSIQDDLSLKGAKLSGDDEAVAAAEGAKAYDETLRKLGDIHGLKAENVALAKQEQQTQHDLTLEQLQSKGATASARDDHQAITEYLREQSALIQGIRQQQQLIAQSPFLGIDAKATATAQLLVQEIATLNLEIAKGRALIKGGTLDPDTYQQVAAKIQQAVFEVQLLQQKVSTLNFAGSLKKDLADWVNSFGTAGQQAGQALQGSVNAALQGTNQLLTGLIDGTANWKQTLVGVEKQVANVFLTWVEQMALQRVASLLGITTTTSAQVASGAAIAAAHAPAAAATSISSYGAAAVVGEVLAVAAIAAIIAALSGAFAEGGVIPGPPSSRDNRLALVATGEGILTADAVQRHGGKSFVDAINHGRLAVPHFDSGGVVGSLGSRSSGSGSGGGKAGDTHIFNFIDLRKMEKAVLGSKAAKKIIVDVVHAAGMR